MTLVLTINGREIPLASGEEISLRRRGSRIGRLDRREGSFSVDFEVPDSEEVRRLLEYVVDPTVDTSGDGQDFDSDFSFDFD